MSNQDDHFLKTELKTIIKEESQAELIGFCAACGVKLLDHDPAYDACYANAATEEVLMKLQGRQP